MGSQGGSWRRLRGVVGRGGVILMAALLVVAMPFSTLLVSSAEEVGPPGVVARPAVLSAAVAPEVTPVPHVSTRAEGTPEPTLVGLSSIQSLVDQLSERAAMQSATLADMMSICNFGRTHRLDQSGPRLAGPHGLQPPHRVIVAPDPRVSLAESQKATVEGRQVAAVGG